VKRQKNDEADAEAICEAATRPHMRFVSIKTENQQAVLVLHRSRDLLMRQRTMILNAILAHLAEFGTIIAQGPRKVVDLVRRLSVPDGGLDLPALARSAFLSLAAHPVVDRAAVTRYCNNILSTPDDWLGRREGSGP
jgi:transposase